jgi:hypothetical protein
MATRTAPTVDGTLTSKAVTISLIDSSGDERSVRLVVPAAATDAQIEALVAALQAGSNASVYRVSVQSLYEGAKLASNATNAVKSSVYDNIVLLAKESAIVSQNNYIPAPLGAIIASGDVVDTSNSLYTAWRDATITLLAGSYVAQSVRFTERREKNDSVPAT